MKNKIDLIDLEEALLFILEVSLFFISGIIFGISQDNFLLSMLILGIGLLVAFNLGGKLVNRGKHESKI